MSHLSYGLELIEKKIAVADNSAMQIANLHGDSDDGYLVVCSFKPHAKANATMSVTFNDDTGANYGWNLLIGTTSAAASRGSGNSIPIALVATNEQSEVIFIVPSSVKGFVRGIRSFDVEGMIGLTAMNQRFYAGSWSNTADEIITMEVRSSITDAIKQDSSIKVYRMKSQ